MKKKTLFLAAAVSVCAWALSAKKKRYLKCRVMPMEDPVEPQEELPVEVTPTVEPVAVDLVQEETEVVEESDLPDVCYYTANGGVWHYARSCSYLKNAEDILRSPVQEAERAGKLRPCSRCASAFAKA